MQDERAGERQGPSQDASRERARPTADKRGKRVEINPAQPFLNEVLGLVSPPKKEGPPKVDNPKLGRLAEGVFDDARLQKHTPQELEDLISEGDQLARDGKVPEGQWRLLKAVFAKEKERLTPSVQKEPSAVLPSPGQVVIEAATEQKTPFQIELEMLTTSVGELKPSVDNRHLVELAQEASKHEQDAYYLQDLIGGGDALSVAKKDTLSKTKMVPEDQWKVLKAVLEHKINSLQGQATVQEEVAEQARVTTPARERQGAGRTSQVRPETQRAEPGWVQTIRDLIEREQPVIANDALFRLAVLATQQRYWENPEEIQGLLDDLDKMWREGQIPRDVLDQYKVLATAMADGLPSEEAPVRERPAPTQERPAQTPARAPATPQEAVRAGRLTEEEIRQVLGEMAGARGTPGTDRLGNVLVSQYRFSEDMAERRREFSEKLEFLEASEYDFENMANYGTLSELISGLRQFTQENNELKRQAQSDVIRRKIEINQALINEFWARYSLHNYNNRFRGAPDIGTMLQHSGLVSPEKLQILFRIPGVAEGLRVYEEKGFEFMASPADRREQIRAEIARRIEQRVRNGVRGEAAQKLAENLWHITGRAAYFDAYNPNSDKRIKGEGPYILARLFNFPEWIKTKKDIRRFWTTTKYGEYLNLGIKDFWSGKWTDIQKAEGNRRIRRSLQVTPDSRGFIASLRNVPFEQLDLKNAIPETAFTGHYDGINKADACRPFLVDPIRFLERPHKENFEELWKVFGHLGGRKQEFFEGLTEALIEFNRRRILKIDLKNKLILCFLIPGHGSYSEHELKWAPWRSSKIRALCEESVNEGVLTREQANRLESRYGAGLAEQTVKEQTSATMKAVPGATLDTVVAFFKAVLGIK